MRKLYPGVLLGTLLLFLGLFSQAQVSVTATGGTTSASYTYLSAAFNAINAGTHTGAITVRITANVADTGACVLGPSAAPASYTSILVKPAAGVTPTISGSVTSVLVALVAATNVTIDGSNTTGGTTKDLTIVNNSNTASTSSNTIRLQSGASNNVIKNTIIKGATSGSGVILVAGSTSGSGNNNNTFENNDITKSVASPVAAVFNTGATGFPNTGNIYRNNRIFDFGLYGFIDGIANSATSGFSSNTLVEGNEFFQSAPNTGGLVAISINNPSNIVNMQINKNKIYNMLTSSATSSIVGIDLYDAVSVSVTNNFISLSSATSPSIRGIAQQTGTPATIKIYHNTVYLYGAASDTSVSFAFLKNYTSTNDDVRNNIFVNKRVSVNGKQYVMANVSTGTLSSSYNDLFAGGNTNNIIGRVGATDYASLAAYQATGTEANSVNIDPVFVSNTDLHLDPTAANNATLDNKGTAISAVTTDIDGTTRSTTTPDLGADEFTANAQCQTPAITAQPTAQTVCSGALNLAVTATGTGLQYQWKRDGSNISGATSATYNAAGATSGNYQVVVSNACGSVTSNTVAVVVNPKPTVSFTATQAQCMGTAYSYTNTSTIASGSIASTVWTFGPSVSIANNPTNTFAAAGTYAVKLVVTSNAGCKDSVSQNVVVSNCTSVPTVDANISSVVLMPNVVADATVLRVVAGRTATIRFAVVDAQGKVVMTFNKQVLAGQNDIPVQVGQLPAGMYTISGDTGKGKTATLRMVKM